MSNRASFGLRGETLREVFGLNPIWDMIWTLMKWQTWDNEIQFILTAKSEFSSSSLFRFEICFDYIFHFWSNQCYNCIILPWRRGKKDGNVVGSNPPYKKDKMY